MAHALLGVLYSTVCIEPMDANIHHPCRMRSVSVVRMPNMGEWSFGMRHNIMCNPLNNCAVASIRNLSPKLNPSAKYYPLMQMGTRQAKVDLINKGSFQSHNETN